MSLFTWPNTIGILLLAAYTIQQKIWTNTNTEGAYTTGNMIDLPKNLDLYSPPHFDIPMILDAALYHNISKYQDYKNNWIVDLSNIDSKEFTPEDPNYTLAVQRRGIPYFYLAKIIIIAALLLLVARLFYGYLGGFRQKVKILKSPQKRIGNRIIIIGTVLYFLFSTQYLIGTFYSIKISEQYLTRIIYNYALDSAKTVNDVYSTLNKVNNNSMPAYYAVNEFEMFHIANLMNTLIPESELSIKKSKKFKEDIEKFQQRHLSRSIMVVVGIYMLVSLLRFAFKNRKIYYSLGSAFSFLALIALCCVLNGFFFNFATIKIEMCQQSTELIKLEKFPLYGQGVASVVTSFSNTAKTKMQEQIYEFNHAIYSSYVMYCNRLKAMEQYESWNKITENAQTPTGGVWSIFFDYTQNRYRDKILTDSVEMIKLVWRMYYQVTSLLESRLLKFWSFQYSNNVCRNGVAIDLASFSLLFLNILCILIIFMGAWMNEYIIRCIIYEESRFMNIEKYRYDWT